MTPVEWPFRLIPRRSPPFLHCLAVLTIGLAVAIGLRLAFLGSAAGLGLSITYLPALMVVTLYAGAPWGLVGIATALLLSVFAPSPLAPPGAFNMLTLIFLASSSITVGVAAVLRGALIRLDEANWSQRLIQQALDRTEARLRLAQEAGGVGLWDVDLESGQGYWSPSLHRNLGLDLAAEIDLRSSLAVAHPDDRERLRRANVQALKRGRMEPTEFRVVWPDGSLHWLLSRGEIILGPDGRAMRAVGVSIDITERRMADQQVRESEARFRALANSAPALMWISRPDGRREFVNQTYVDFVGETYEATLAFDWRKRLHPDDVQRILREQVAGESSRQAFSLEARYQRKDGEHRWIRSFSHPRLGPAGEFIGWVGIGLDVTDAKRAEADLMRINELLAERVQAALAERDTAEAALRRAQKLEAVGQLTGGVAHDFNNLLTVIIGALDLVQRHPGDAARRERMLEAALGAARRGERLTQQLLAFSRRQSLKPEVVRVDDLLRENQPLLRQAVGEAVSLISDLRAGPALARIDPGQFEAAVMNLAVNARDAVAQGGVVRLETSVCRLEAGQVEETAPGDYVCVAVHDTGVGMDAEVMGRVFEPFFTTKEVGKGTGLGLSQVYGFARQSEGGVAIESMPGKGASVRIYLPLALESATAAEQPARPAPVAARGPRLRVLLAEDDAEVGDMVAAMLEELGHEVLRAEAAEPALALLARGDPVDLLLTDLVMPGGKTGLDLAHAAAAQRPGLSVILSSGYTGAALGPADGAPWPLLRKPYSSEVLARAIAEVTAPLDENV